LKAKDIAVIGGAEPSVGEVLAALEACGLPAGRVRLLATPETLSGESLSFRGQDVRERLLDASAFDGAGLAVFAAGASLARRWAAVAAAAGCWVIDATGAFSREVPVVVPELNAGDLPGSPGVIANPSPASVALSLALAPLARAAALQRVVVSSYHGASGLGRAGTHELSEQTRAVLSGGESEPTLFPHRLAFNVVPQTDAFETEGPAAGWTREEARLADETPRILKSPDLGVTATAARVPVFVGIALSVNVALRTALAFEKARESIAEEPGVRLVDEPAFHLYPLLAEIAGRDDVYVGRMRPDPTVAHGLNLWIAADDLRRGIGLNVAGIAEALVERGLL
jgi:aspartate-semialdehyde dehydrogenase